MRLPPEREKFKGLTTSMFSAAMGINKYTSRQKLYKRLKGEEVFEGNDATEYGHSCEPYAASAYEAEFGNLLIDAGSEQRFKEFRLGDYLIVGSTPDGWDAQDGCVTEFKCPYSQKVYAEDYWKQMYMPQLQGQMVALKAGLSRFCVWTPDEFAVWEVPYQKEYVDFMVPYLEDFWDCIRSDTPPKRRKRPVPPDVTVERII